jgi:hypothetical protein
MTRQLIVNADDFGMSPAVSRGILEAHHHGIVTSTTVMIVMPEAGEALAQAVESIPNLGFGLHVVLAGQCAPALPAEQVPTLVRSDGRFYDGEFYWSLTRDHFNADEVRAEIHAQCRRFIDFAGRPPTHLDSHYHAAYLHPAALSALFDLAEEYDIPIRNPGVDLNNLDDTLRRRVGDGLYDDLRPIYDRRRLPRWPLETLALDSDTTVDKLIEWVRALPEGVTEMMCHPGRVDDLLIERDGWTDRREPEIALLSDPAVRAAISAEGVELVTFSALRS